MDKITNKGPETDGKSGAAETPTIGPLNSSARHFLDSQAELEAYVQGKCGCLPKDGLQYGLNKAQRFGKKQKYSWNGFLNQKGGTLHDYSTGITEILRIGRADGEYSPQKPRIPAPAKPPKKPEIKDCTAEFEKLKPCPADHPYFKKKGVPVPPGVRCKEIPTDHSGGFETRAAVPVFSPAGRLISWQWISPSGGKKFKAGHSLGSGYFFPIPGDPAKGIFVCEGLATGLSIHAITGGSVACAFGKSNLAPVTISVLAENPEAKEVKLSLDNDAEKTARIALKDPRLVILCPAKKGDFNDFQDDPAERKKLIEGAPVYSPPAEPEPEKGGAEKPLSDDDILQDAPGECRKAEFHDRWNLFPARKISVVAGEADIMKSTAMYSYFADRPFGYFSAGEMTTDDAKEKAVGLNSVSHYKWIDFDHWQNPDFWKRVKRLIIDRGLQAIVLDPAPAFKGGIDDAATREYLKRFAKLADDTNTAIIFIRGYSKAEYESEIKRIMGSAGWYYFARAVFIVRQCEEGSLGQPEPPNPGKPPNSYMQCVKRNGSPKPPFGVLISQESKPVTDDVTREEYSASLCGFEKRTPAGGDHETMWKKPPEPDPIKQDTHYHWLAGLFKEKEAWRAGEIVTRAMRPKEAAENPGRGIERSATFSILKKLVDRKWLEKHGRQPKTHYTAEKAFLEWAEIGAPGKAEKAEPETIDVQADEPGKEGLAANDLDLPF